jgi:hypothetical protein
MKHDLGAPMSEMGSRPNRSTLTCVKSLYWGFNCKVSREPISDGSLDFTGSDVVLG